MSGSDKDKPYDYIVTTTAVTSVEGINDFSLGCVMD
jgi:hypothetical protein